MTRALWDGKDSDKFEGRLLQGAGPGESEHRRNKKKDGSGPQEHAPCVIWPDESKHRGISFPAC